MVTRELAAFFLSTLVLSAGAISQAIDMPNDPMLPEQWYVSKIKASQAWDISLKGSQVVVAVIDTGMDLNHEDLRDNLWINPHEIANNGIDDDNNGFIDDIKGWDFQGNDNNPSDEDQTNRGHGTMAGGVIGATANNARGISGVGRNVKLMPIRAFAADGTSTANIIAQSIDYATNNGAQVINASWGGYFTRTQAQAITDALERARMKNVIFVAAAGNEGQCNDRTDYFPKAGLDNVIVVAASNQQDGAWLNSNFGKSTVDLSAPGEDVLTTLLGNRYGLVCGTSIAAPVVSAVVALMKSLDPKLDGQTIKAILQSTGTPVPIETACNCRIDAQAAIKAMARR